MNNVGYRLTEKRIIDLVRRVATRELTLPDADDVTSLDAMDSVTAMLAGRPIGVFAAADGGVVVGGARLLAALACAFQSPSSGGLSVVDLMSDSPAVAVGSRPDGRSLGEYLPLAATLETMAYLRWRQAVASESVPSKRVLDRLEKVAACVAGYSAPVLWLPHGMDRSPRAPASRRGVFDERVARGPGAG